MIKVHCDNKLCDHTRDEDAVQSGWLTVERDRSEFGLKSKFDYCSIDCLLDGMTTQFTEDNKRRIK